jgi:RNA polymerase sigma factor (TIGR02999 family)
MPVVYAELRKLARSYLRKERPDHTLQATALVNEAFLRLVDQKNVDWQNRAHFFGIAAQAMRRILVDHARKKRASKRGSGKGDVPFDEAKGTPFKKGVDLVALDECLAGLEEIDPRQCRIVELKYFVGLSIEETAELVGTSPATVKREWAVAKAWLHREMRKSKG